jgi:hypothetical protein
MENITPRLRVVSKDFFQAKWKSLNRWGASARVLLKRLFSKEIAIVLGYFRQNWCKQNILATPSWARGLVELAQQAIVTLPAR